MRALLAAAVVALAGCVSSSGFTGMCAVQQAGVTDGGVNVFRIHCEPAK